MHGENRFGALFKPLSLKASSTLSPSLILFRAANLQPRTLKLPPNHADPHGGSWESTIRVNTRASQLVAGEYMNKFECLGTTKTLVAGAMFGAGLLISADARACDSYDLEDIVFCMEDEALGVCLQQTECTSADVNSFIAAQLTIDEIVLACCDRDSEKVATKCLKDLRVAYVAQSRGALKKKPDAAKRVKPMRIVPRSVLPFVLDTIAEYLETLASEGSCIAGDDDEEFPDDDFPDDGFDE